MSGVGDAHMSESRSVLMTVEELAERWDVHPLTIRGMIAKGTIKALRIGRLVKISRSHVEFLEANGQT